MRIEMQRQGDVLLVRVPAGLVASGLRIAARAQGRIVLAEGEVTGHAHAIADAGCDLLVLDDRAAMAEAVRELLASVGLMAELSEEAVIGVLAVSDAGDVEVRHEEHAPLNLPAGSRYVAIRQREYTPERLNLVAD